jgi:hypothetical protein
VVRQRARARHQQRLGRLGRPRLGHDQARPLHVQLHAHPGTDDFRDDLGANEATGGSGYTAGGFTLGSKTLAATSLTLNWDAADISQAITGGPFAFRYGVFYKSRGGASSADEIIGYVDFGAQSVTDATINITLTNQLTITAS